MDMAGHKPAGTSPIENSDELQDVDYVNVARRTVDKPPHTSGKKYLNHLLIITLSWGVLLLVTVPRIYFTFVLSENNFQLMTENQRLSLNIQELQANNTLQSQNENLTFVVAQLKSKNQELQEKIEKLEVVSVSRTQSIIDAYCPIPKNGGDRRCGVCAAGWLHIQSSCYAVNDAQPKYRKSWEDAEKDCTSKGSHLAVIDNDIEKNFISEWSWGGLPYWIGLKVVDGGWKWLNGTSLSQITWIGPPQNGHCASSYNNGTLGAAVCTDKRRWICEKKALTL